MPAVAVAFGAIARRKGFVFSRSRGDDLTRVLAIILDRSRHLALRVPFQQIQRSMCGSENVAQVRAPCRCTSLLAFALRIEQLLPAVGEGPAQAAGRAHHKQLGHHPTVYPDAPEFKLWGRAGIDGR